MEPDPEVIGQLLSSLPRVRITPQAVSQSIIDDWYRREARYREQINNLTAHLDTDHGIMVQLGIIADSAVKMLEHVNMDTDEDRELHARAVGALRGRLSELAAAMKEADDGGHPL